MTALRSLLVCILTFATINAQSVNLGTAKTFAVLGASTVTNTGATVLNGDLGVSPGTAITGFPPGIDNGVTHLNDGVAQQAQIDANNAFTVAAGLPFAPGNNLSGQNLGSKTLPPAVYHFSSSAFLTGTLILDGGNNPNSVFVFQIGSTLITASNAVVLLQNGAQACNVFWQVGSSATLGTGTLFAGNVLAQASITVNTGATNNGGLYALTAAVTLQQNTVNAQTTCTSSSSTTSSTTSTSTSSTSTTSSSAPTSLTTTKSPTRSTRLTTTTRSSTRTSLTTKWTAGPLCHNKCSPFTRDSSKLIPSDSNAEEALSKESRAIGQPSTVGDHIVTPVPVHSSTSPRLFKPLLVPAHRAAIG